MTPSRPSETELRRAEGLYGPQPNPAPAKAKLRLISGKPIVKGTLRFIGKFGLPFAGDELEIPDIMAFTSHGKSWANLPSKPILDQNGVHMTDANGKKMYAPMLAWSSKEMRDRFSAAVVALIKEQYPTALDDDESGATQPGSRPPRSRAVPAAGRLYSSSSSQPPRGSGPGLHDDPISDLWPEGSP